MTNDWCRVLGIDPPNLVAVVGHREANTFALFLVALVERGAPMTLEEVAQRFEEAGVADRWSALSSLQRCKPGRSPAYRDGERYHLDPHDHELDLWMFRLGLRPAKFARPASPAPAASPLPGPDVLLTEAELDEAWKDASLHNMSDHRLATAVLDAHGGPLSPAEVVASVARRTKWHRRAESSAQIARKGSAIVVLDDGRWAMANDAGDTLRRVRELVRERLALVRRYARPDPAAIQAISAAAAQRRAAHGAALASLARALVVVFPSKAPRAAALLDVGEHTLTTFVDAEMAALREQLASYAVIGGLDIRALLRAVDFDPGDRRLAELGPPQKTKQLNKSGRTLKITVAQLVQGSCGITKPFGDPAKLAEYLASGAITKLRSRLEADVKSLYALYEYGRLHGVVRLRWGFLDDDIPAPWVHRDEPTIHELMKSALAMDVPLEVVVGSAPGWSDPWSRARIAHVENDPTRWRTWLVDDDGLEIDRAEVQRARLAGGVRVH